MKNILLILVSLYIAACAGQGGPKSTPPISSVPTTTETVQVPIETALPIAEVIPTNTPTPIRLELDYYSKTETINTCTTGTSKGFTFDETGYCTNYNGQEYCWDDGLHSDINICGEGIAYSYWMIGHNYMYPSDTSLQNCISHCSTDSMSEPNKITTDLSYIINLHYNAQQGHEKVMDLFKAGNIHHANCLQVDTKISCVDYSTINSFSFVIDLNKPTL